MSRIEFIPFHGCWEWIGHKNRGGYGTTYFDGRARKAHRVSWMIYFGDPGELGVLHKCDRPSCVRPEHLFLGDQSANMLDASAKGRHGMSAKTHCKRGHPFGSEKRKGRRRCNQCGAANAARARASNNTQEWRAKRNAREREKRKDPAYRARNLEKQRAYYRKTYVSRKST